MWQVWDIVPVPTDEWSISLQLQVKALEQNILEVYIVLFLYSELLQVAIFPTLSGWWIDICSLKLCDSTLADRINYLYTAPGTTTFLHWLVRSSPLFHLISLLSLPISCFYLFLSHLRLFCHFILLLIMDSTCAIKPRITCCL